MSGMAGLVTGVATPRTASSLRPFVLAYQPHYEHTFLVPTGLFLTATHFRDGFLAQQPIPSQDYPVEFESTTELVARFLAYIADRVNEAGEGEELLNVVLAEFENRFLRGNEVHAIAAQTEGDVEKKKTMIKAYYTARILSGREIKGHDSALFRAAANEEAGIFAIFGGQGFEDYFNELRGLYTVYGTLIGDFVTHMAEFIAKLGQSDQSTRKVYSKGLDVLRWLQDADSLPDSEYLISAPVSLPLIGVTQLTHYAIMCRVLGREPGQIAQILKGATGHSQGIVTAAAVAASTDWSSFLDQAHKAVTILFWIGCRSQESFPVTNLPPAVLQDSLANGEGQPTPMLSVRDLVPSHVQKFVDSTNEFLPDDRQIAIALINGPRNLVVVGPPHSLHGLNLALRKLKAPQGLEQGRVPHSERKLKFMNRFLPISCPFHSPYLIEAGKRIKQDLEGVKIDASEMAFPVYTTNNGTDLRASDNVVQDLVDMITHLPVHWEKASACKDVTHIVDFGPGGVSGLGTLTHRNKDGTGVRIVLAGAFEGGNVGFGYKPELFDREDGAVRFNADWVKAYQPRLVRTSQGRTYVDTTFSRLLGKPPLMVAGMTPCTVPWEFCAATINAGYHIEMAGGGFFMASMMADSINKIEVNTTPGAGICINIIYINPRTYQMQVDLVKQLRSTGVPIEGITIGAGVPSLEIANELIASLGLKYIAFKPGSSEAIQQVVAIARSNPDFPVICQWTGGRGGGHHSFEDFHQPILQMYSTVRRHSNMILIAG